MNKVNIKFGVINTLNNELISSKDNNLNKNLFAIDSFKIKTTLDNSFSEEYGEYNEKRYFKYFNKEVIWDFGDGTTLRGISGEHFYKLPGIYKITCRFIDINRLLVENDFYLNVEVKQVIPTKISFIDEAKKDINVSEITNIANLEVLLSNNISQSLEIEPKRIFDKEDSTEKNYFELGTVPFKHFKEYYSFFEESTDYNVNKKRYNPCKLYKPDYEDLYCSFSTNESEIILNLYKIYPYSSYSGKEYITLYDINSDNENESSDNYKDFLINVVSDNSELPEDCFYVGKYANLSIYYKSDIKYKTKISYNYKLDNNVLTSGLKNSKNYINFIPLGHNFVMNNNKLDNLTLNSTITGVIDENEFTNSYFYNSLFVGKKIKTYLVLEEKNNFNYIPKDLIITDISIELLNDTKAEYLLSKITDQVYSLEFTPNSKNVDFNIKYTVNNTSKTFNVKKDNITDLSDFYSLKLKSKEYNYNDIESTLLPNQIFEEKPLIKSMLKDIFGGEEGFINKFMNKSELFIDDNLKLDTCYINNLLNILKMLNVDTSEYDNLNFDSINDLKELTRILSINHSKLVGKEYISNDFNLTEENKGKQLSIKDIIYFNDKGLVTKIKSNDILYNLNYPTKIIIEDNFNKNKSLMDFSSNIYDFNGMYFDEELNEKCIKIELYEPSWNWNLILPSKETMENTNSSIEDFYSFYLLNKNISTEVSGNLLKEKNITSIIKDLERWEKDFGTKYELFYKLLNDKLK